MAKDTHTLEHPPAGKLLMTHGSTQGPMDCCAAAPTTRLAIATTATRRENMFLRCGSGVQLSGLSRARWDLRATIENERLL